MTSKHTSICVYSPKSSFKWTSYLLIFLHSSYNKVLILCNCLESLVSLFRSITTIFTLKSLLRRLKRPDRSKQLVQTRCFTQSGLTVSVWWEPSSTHSTSSWSRSSTSSTNSCLTSSSTILLCKSSVSSERTRKSAGTSIHMRERRTYPKLSRGWVLTSRASHIWISLDNWSLILVMHLGT